ncbi:ataxin-3-like [Diadema antillarum]|uniref:ataxin-3-like n=1 Tax=Diadema antillarum TaxID=105358 RepID=UPI003A8C1E2B
MAEGDVNSPEYLRFLQQPSANMDDSGFFSVQVISRALSVWELGLVPIGSSEAGGAFDHPGRELAFICNFREHWLTIRKLGHQWFNLNSLLTGPELISDTYLSMFLAQLQRDGYSIFVVRGKLPECEADQLLALIPAVQTERPKLLTDQEQSSSSGGRTTSSTSSSTGVGVTQDDLQRALAASRNSLTRKEEEENTLQEAIQLSLQGTQVAATSETPVDIDEVRRRREAYFNRQATSQPSQGSSSGQTQAAESRVTPTLQCSSAAKDCPSERLQGNTNSSAKAAEQSCVPGTRTDMVENTALDSTAGEDEDLTESAMLEAAIKMSMESVEQKT